MQVSSVSSDGSVPAAEPTGAVAVRATNLFKIYKEGATETVALQGASVDLRRGEFVSLVGPSGSGKTTLLWVLAGLVLPSAGQVRIDGTEITALDESGRAATRARHIGVVFQRGNLIPFLTAEENVVLALTAGGRRRKARARARELLGDLGLGDRRRHRPAQLSGGEAQRVGVAVAIAHEPSVLLGDEITGELDSATADEVIALLIDLRRDRDLTMLLVTHNPSLAELADRQLVITDGRVTS